MIDQVKELIEQSNKITVLTGAGISTESGIADFRSPGGVWDQYKVVTIQEFMSSREKRIYYWKYKSATIPQMLKAKPNAAHEALGRLDKQGKLLYVLTQNIDGLHEKGGVDKSKIINLHGTNSEAICLKCKDILDIQIILNKIEQGEEEPLCERCGGFLKPNTVSFGQNLNQGHLLLADKASRECDLFMALGSSLVVTPAASFVGVAYQSGHPLIIINQDETPYDNVATYKLNEKLAIILPQLVD